jgi:GNAT superfamily N-acetyltransferase
MPRADLAHAEVVQQVQRLQRTIYGCPDETADTILTGLRPSQRERLIKAIGEVERLLAASAIELRVCDPRHDDAKACMDTYFAELAERYGGFDPDISRPLPPDKMVLPAGLLLMAYLRDEPVGCAALSFLPENVGAIKRVWVCRTMRGVGLGRRMMTALEDRARAHGVRRLRLETKDELHEAMQMYINLGFREVEPFNDEFYADHWFEKPLTDH